MCTLVQECIVALAAQEQDIATVCDLNMHMTLSPCHNPRWRQRECRLSLGTLSKDQYTAQYGARLLLILRRSDAGVCKMVCVSASLGVVNRTSQHMLSRGFGLR